MINIIEIILGRELLYSEIVCVWIILGFFVISAILSTLGWVLTARDKKRRRDEQKQGK